MLPEGFGMGRVENEFAMASAEIRQILAEKLVVKGDLMALGSNSCGCTWGTLSGPRSTSSLSESEQHPMLEPCGGL